MERRRGSSDSAWAQESREASVSAASLLGLLILFDAGTGGLTPGRAVLWAALSLLLLAVLMPPRVSAGEGWLASRGILRGTWVRTDCLVSVRWSDGVAQRLVLCDAEGRRVEIDPRLMVRNPEMWHRLDADARASLDRGTLTCGATAMRELAERIDRETARTIFKVSDVS
ncbi:hypothetical protein [Streptomyces sp. NPDC101115]|uniref:hypothetical protein n=1 Tax=Streptomyces sp. NPDC101115 TaxID=3366106 RepID=UPI003808E7BE